MRTFQTILLTLFASWLTISLNAQAFTQVDTLPDPFTSIRELYYELDTLQMPTGYLIDASWAMADVTPYKGNVIPPDSMAVDFGDYQSLYISAFGMSMTEATKNSFLTFRHMRAGMFARDTARLHGIALAYNRLDPAAAADNLITIDTAAYRLYDVPGRPRSPYLPDTMVTITIAGGRTDTLSQNFIFEQQDLLGQLSNASNFYLDAGQGFIKHEFGELFSLTFPSFDEYQLTLKLATTGGWKYAKVKLNLEQALYKTAEATCDESVAFSGGKYCIKFSGKCGERLFRPLIVVNGFDPTGEGDLRLARLNREFNFEFSESHIYSGLSLKEILIEDYGYDIIFITFTEGTASNITTGDWLVNAIKSINARKLADGVTEETPIIGVSMGGLVTKIAIAKMEADNYDHQLSKFFSFDTPLRGANIPVGLQHAAAHVYRAKVLGVLIRKLDCGIRETGSALFNPAAREMLLASASAEATYRQWPAPSTIAHTTTTADHIAFQNYFDGLSINVPHYAISNGAASGDQSVVGSGTSQIVPSGLILDIKSLPVPVSMRIKANFLPQCFSVNAGGFLISPASVNLFVGGLPNYDMLAGGTRGTHDPGEKKNCKGKHPKKKSPTQEYVADYHSFIPTRSSLNLTLPGELPGSGTGSDYSFSMDEMLASRHNDVPYTVQNHSHVTVTPGLADFLVNNLIPVSDLSPTALDPSSSILSYPYNYGQSSAGTGGFISTATYFHGELGVHSSGAILVNNDNVIGNTTIASNPQNNLSPFTLTLSAGPCDSPPADITLESGTEFIVGHGLARTATVNALAETRITSKAGSQLVIDRGSAFYLYSNGPDDQGGVVIESGGLLDAGETSQSSFAGKFIVDGGTLRVKAGGQLRTSYSGQIIARNGGKIILENGALVQLWAGADPESEGTVWIQDGGELVIEGAYDFSGSGYWQFDSGNKISGTGDLVIEGDGNDFRRMKVNSGAKVLLHEGQDFLIQNTKVEYGADGNVTVVDGSKFEVANVKFEGPASPAILTDGSVRSSIDNSEFLDNKRGVVLNQDGPLSALSVNNSLFQSSTIAGVTFKGWSPDNFGRTPSINGCTFSGCQVGVEVDNFIAADLLHSTFTSSEAYQFAIRGEDCQRLLVSECTVTGFETHLGFSSHEGAVELELVNAKFSGGEYTSNTVAINDRFGSILSFDECVEVSANCYGIATAEIPGGITTLALDGMSLLNNSIGIHGGSGIITSGGINSFQMPESSSCDFATTPRLIYMDVNQMAIPTITLDGNHWMDPQGNPLLQLDPWSWFCIDIGGGRGCDPFAIPTNKMQLQGCGSGPCENPETCEFYCQLYPENPLCYGGGQVFSGFTVSPNPSGGIVALSHLPEDGGTLHVFDARGALLKVVNLDQSTYQTLDLSELSTGIYTLQLLKHDVRAVEAVRLIISRE